MIAVIESEIPAIMAISAISAILPIFHLQSSPMRRVFSLAGSVLFVFYCTAVGVYLLLRPWSPSARAAAGISASGFFRGFVSGLGLVHLAAGIADLRSLSRALGEPLPGPEKQ